MFVAISVTWKISKIHLNIKAPPISISRAALFFCSQHFEKNYIVVVVYYATDVSKNWKEGGAGGQKSISNNSDKIGEAGLSKLSTPKSSLLLNGECGAIQLDTSLILNSFVPVSYFFSIIDYKPNPIFTRFGPIVLLDRSNEYSTVAPCCSRETPAATLNIIASAWCSRSPTRNHPGWPRRLLRGSPSSPQFYHLWCIRHVQLWWRTTAMIFIHTILHQIMS